MLSFQQPSITKDVHLKRQNLPNADDKPQSSSEDFIDNYYLLNDGKTKLETSPSTTKKLNLIDPVSIDIDLDLDKKFRDLKINPSTNSSTFEFNDVYR